MATTRGGTRVALVTNLAAIVGATLAINGLIFGLGWDGGPDPASTSRLTPPGWVVGSVWMVLMAALAIARWRLGGPDAAAERGWVTLLIVSCLAYPFYAIATRSLAAAFAGNLATIALAGFVAGRVWPASRAAAACVAPIVPWVLFATATSMVDWGWLGRRG